MENEHLRYLTRQACVDALVSSGNCDSATLYISKFPYIIPPGIGGDLKKGAEDKKKKELKEFCSKVENSKRFMKNSLLLPKIPGSISFTAVNKGRLLVNHTGGIVENSNLSLHRFLGFPMIPGSALKGIARNAARFDEDKERFARVFGGEKKGESKEAGSVSFLMAIPENTDWKLTVDVLTSHGGSDTQNPVPVFFPAVETGATFRFIIAPTARTKDGDLEFAVQYLKKALSENGVGAKTAVGYGWFEIEEKIELPPEEEVAAYGLEGLEDRLDEIILSDNQAKQIAYINRMLSLKAKRSLLRRRRDKNDPYYEKFKSLVEKYGMELPE